MSLEKDITCWVVTEGLKGTENQCLGVAESLEIDPKVIQVHLSEPWKSLSPYLRYEQDWTFTPRLAPPWPDLLLASGRKSIAASRYIRKLSGGKTFTVQIQDPRISSKHFDLVAVPAHDPMRGDNVLVTSAAPNRIRPKLLEDAVSAFPQLAQMKETQGKPCVAVLIGGNSKDYVMTQQIVTWLIDALLSHDAFFMVTMSRRTPEKYRNQISKTLENTSHYVWDEKSENPYFAMLALSDYVMVTVDSVSMVSDAATVGKPIYILGMERRAKSDDISGPPTTRIETFHQLMAHKGISRPFKGEFETPWHYKPLRDADMIAEEIRARLALKG